MVKITLIRSNFLASLSVTRATFQFAQYKTVTIFMLFMLVKICLNDKKSGGNALGLYGLINSIQLRTQSQWHFQCT